MSNAWGSICAARRVWAPRPRSQNGQNGKAKMLSDWNCLSDETQLLISREALRRAVAAFAGQAEVLAAQIEAGILDDRGGPDALRLLAAITRVADDCNAMKCVGNA